MIFKETWQQVLDGTKTQTRRPVKEGEYLAASKLGFYPPHVISKNGYLKWQVGRTYAVVPGRSKPAIWIPPEGAPIDDALAEYVRKAEGVRATWGPKVKEWLRSKGYREARIRITKIRRESLWDTTEEDARAEGAQPYRGQFYTGNYRTAFIGVWSRIYKKKPYRWEDNPEVWVLAFQRTTLEQA